MKYLAVVAFVAALIVPSLASAQGTPVLSHDEAWWTTVKYMNHHSKTWKLARHNHTTNLADGIEVAANERILIAKWIYKGVVHTRTVDITKLGFNKYSIKVRSS
jgi:hypothetical protein